MIRAWLRLTIVCVLASSLVVFAGPSSGTTVATKPSITILVVSPPGLGLIRHDVTIGLAIEIQAVVEAEYAHPFRSDVYVGVVAPDGQSASWIDASPGPTLVTGHPVPFTANVVLSADTSYRIAIESVGTGGSEGWYMVYGLVVAAGRDPADPANWLSASFFPLLVRPASQ
jgi:hypothetical protein